MSISDLVLPGAALLCTLTAGFLFAFAVVVMPGIRSLTDRDYLNAFRVMDRVIQENDPRFIGVWVGSAALIVAALFVHVTSLAGVDRLLLVGAAIIYILGVQLPTIVVNIPINNELQRTEFSGSDAAADERLRTVFENRWIPWNTFRTIAACLAAALLLALITRM